MPSGEQVSVAPGDLVVHAGHLESVAADVGLAARAGAATAPGMDAYGKLCVMVPVLLGQLQDIVVDAIDAAEHSLRDSADRVRQAAVGYRDCDERSAAAVRRAGGVL
jgi:hypothetical protein